MSTGIDIKFVQERYKLMPDDELISIATQDASGLTPQAIEAMKTEIQKRGLNDNISKGIDAQNKNYSIEEIDAYCDIVSRLNCPFCNKSNTKLNATLTSEVMSFIFITTYNKKLKVACPHCLDKANKNALIKTAILGWWGIPWGIIRTPQAIARNLKSKRTNHSQEHNDFLRNYTFSVIGELETYKNNKEKLQEILIRQNSL